MSEPARPSSHPELAHLLRDRSLHVEEPVGALPSHAAMHDRGAVVPAIVVSPRSEAEVSQTLRLLTERGLHAHVPVSVRSGGHGYFNGASCAGLMLSLSKLDRRRIEGDTLILETGCLLGHVVSLLAQHRKAVPHGDCFGVGAGGHFLTAGWDLMLARRYGLGCQAVIGGRLVLWDGEVIEVTADTHPKLLWALRGGAAAAAGVVTELRLRLLDEPAQVTWRHTALDASGLARCAAHQVLARAAALPREITVSFHFHFEPESDAPVASFNISSLLSPAATLPHLAQHLGPEITALVGDLAGWATRPLLEFRLLPASDELAAHPERLAKVSGASLHDEPERYWKPALCAREMAAARQSQVSRWIVPESAALLVELHRAFETARAHPQRYRMYALVVVGGGRIAELRDHCAMPLGSALARFEVHWDDTGAGSWSERFVAHVDALLRAHEDPVPGRPYRGDAWRVDQTRGPELDAILARYDRRPRGLAT